MDPLLDWSNIIALVARYLHVVCATLLVGGTLFYEMVVPVAIADLKPEIQLAVFGRARWMFRQIVWWSAALIIITGLVSGFRHHVIYTQAGEPAEHSEFGAAFYETSGSPVPAARPGWWVVAHAAVGLLAVVISVLLTIGSSPPGHPIRWMRLNLVILMIVIFLGSATRQVRLNFEEQIPPSQWPMYFPSTQDSP
ncbi:MAG TPA: hypothetical protein VGG19_00635 [Tepidisphaeraceae bacterium]